MKKGYVCFVNGCTLRKANPKRMNEIRFTQVDIVEMHERTIDGQKDAVLFIFISNPFIICGYFKKFRGARCFYFKHQSRHRT